MKIIGKEAARVRPKPSHNPRDPRAGLDKAEMLKRETTMWDLLVWAYKREMVRFSMADDRPEGFNGGSNTSAVCAALAAGFAIRGGGNGVRPAAHEDAYAVHDAVLRLPRDDQWLMVRTAEEGAPPSWELGLKPGRLVPIWRQSAHGRKPKMFYAHNQPIGCWLHMEGLWPHELEEMERKARERYARWRENLEVLADRLRADWSLKSWRIMDTGEPTEGRSDASN